jgi:glutamate-1-semialdehyde 2,1-aminomutase
MKLNKSVSAYKAAKELIPGGVDSPVRAFSAVGGEPPFISHGRGGYIYDIDGNRYIDYVQSWGPLVLGHCDEQIESAVMEAVKKGLSFGAPTLIETELAREVLDLFPNLDKLRFVSSGTEAVMSAIRLARGVTGKNDIVKFVGCYHGHSDSLLVQAGSGLATFGTPSSPGVPADLTKHTLLADYNDLESIKKCFEDSNDIACVIIEPIAGNMGLVPADEAFLAELRTLCDAHNTLLIFDEVMSGFRASLRGASGVVSTQADIVTFGKVIGGGMPVGAFAASKEIMGHLSPEGPIYQAGTLSGNPIAMAAGLSAIKTLKYNPKTYDDLTKKAHKLTSGMLEIANAEGIPLQVTVRGSMFGFFFSDKPIKNFADAAATDPEIFASFHQKMLDRGVYLACSLYETGFISTKTSDEMIQATLNACRSVFKEMQNG